MKELNKEIDLKMKCNKMDRKQIEKEYFKGKVRNNTIQLFSKQ